MLTRSRKKLLDEIVNMATPRTPPQGRVEAGNGNATDQDDENGHQVSDQNVINNAAQMQAIVSQITAAVTQNMQVMFAQLTAQISEQAAAKKTHLNAQSVDARAGVSDGVYIDAHSGAHEGEQVAIQQANSSVISNVHNGAHVGSQSGLSMGARSSVVGDAHNGEHVGPQIGTHTGACNDVLAGVRNSEHPGLHASAYMSACDVEQTNIHNSGRAGPHASAYIGAQNGIHPGPYVGARNAIVYNGRNSNTQMGVHLGAQTTDRRMEAVTNAESMSHVAPTVENYGVMQSHTPVSTSGQGYGKLIELPKFSGDPLEWPMFERSYADTTAEFQYSDMRNLIRIRNALIGDARAAVESMLPFPGSVNDIIHTLKETFGRPEQLMNRQVADLRKLPKIEYGNYSNLIKFSNCLKNMTAFVKYAHAEYRLSDTTLLMECVGKLPYELQVQWAEFKEKIETYPSIEHLSSFLAIAAKRASTVQDSLPRSQEYQRTKQLTNLKGATKGHVLLAARQTIECGICQKECSGAKECQQFKGMSVDERWKKVKELRLCFTCLKPGHSANKCYSKKKCRVNGCDNTHNSLLHKEVTVEPNKKEVAFSAEAHASSSNVWFQILPVEITAHEKTVTTFDFVDHGASHSMMEHDLAQKLGLTGIKDVLEMHWLNNVQVKYPTERVTFQIRGLDAQCKPAKMTNVYTVQEMNLPKQSVNFEFNFGCGKLKKNIKLRYTDAVPELIIGLDYAKLTTALEKPIVAPKEGVVAHRTELGWAVFGPNGEGTNRVFAGCSIKNQLSSLEALMNEYYTNDNIGVLPRQNKAWSVQDERAMKMMENSTTFANNRYEVRLLWASEEIKLPQSYEMAVRRLKGIENKMKADEEFSKQYKAILNDYMIKGYARKLTKEEVVRESDRCFYLPHFAVKNPNKDKIRIVFDAAAKINGCALNNQLLAGPDLNKSLLSVLFKFRQGSIGVCADIREMFLQVSVHKEDQEAQRFLWRGGDSTKEVDVYVMTRMLFGAKCSPTLAQFVKNTNALRYAEYYPRAVDAIVNHHYVDDFVDAFDNDEEAVEVVKQVVHIHRSGGFELRNFSSNSIQVLDAVNDYPEPTVVVNLQGSNVERVLGMHWNCNTDEFIFVLKFHKVREEVLQMKSRPTKREVLSIIMSIFDPFGLLANFVIKGKMLMHSLWKKKVDWDEQLPDEHWSQWQIWLKELEKVKCVREKRCYAPEGKIELHVFADASQHAYAAVAYLRVVNNGKVHVRFVFSKTRCAPLKYTSIPRLELQAAVLAVRIKEVIKIENNWKSFSAFFWSDSTTVLSWINSDSHLYKPYVANRLGEILEHSDPCQWHWVPSALNVADDATRPNKQYEPYGRWLKGPEFLWRENSWPPQPQKFAPNIDTTNEAKCFERVLIANQNECSRVIKYERFSNFNVLRRTMARVLKFGRRWRGKTVESFEPMLNANEVEYAEMTLNRLVQQEKFGAELKCLEDGKPLNKNSRLIGFNPKLDELGILRVAGRIERAECLDFAEKHPILLPKDHEFTKLLADHYHRKFRHLNRNTVICEIRRKYWIPAIRVLMKTIESKCLLCKLRRTKPVPPMMGLLPSDRITPYVRPFTYAGVDFFGPLAVAVRRQREKRWVALFTCLTTRAIHLELVADLSSDACLLAIRNFVNRRGVPKIMRSDNGTNFVGINKELKGVNDFLDFNAIGERVSNLGIEWRFNCPANPSEGGAWERLVQSVKKVLMIVLKECAPRIETLISVLIEAENIINSSPLTHLPVSIEEEEPLTPNHFLLNSPNSTQTPSEYADGHICLRKQWRIAQNLKNHFWSRWIREYLPELTRRSKWCQPSTEMRVGDLVLICDSAAPRSLW